MRRSGAGRLSLGLLMAVGVLLHAAPVGSASAGPAVAECPLFPADSIWNARVDTLPLHPNSASYVATIGTTRTLHPDFGAGEWDGGPIGIPYTTVPGTQPGVSVTFDYWDESDPAPYPIPPGAPIEGGPASRGDRHVLVVDVDQCRLYELYAAYPGPGASWHAGSGAVFDLRSNALRPDTWTSADAAGLPILAGLVRYDEIAAGEIRHALRFTAPVTQKKHVWPARHDASSNTSPSVPPMGQRFRLKATFDISRFPAAVQVILTALQRYGMMLADNGSSWFLSGAPDSRWNDDELVTWLRQVPGSAFEAVDVSSLMVAAGSGQVSATAPPPPPPPPGVTYGFTVTVRGTGRVTSTPTGIDCTTGACGTRFPAGTVVTLSKSGGRFRSWSGSCSGSGSCRVRMTRNHSIGAEFRR